MKRITTIIALVFALAAVAAGPGQLRTSLTLAWDYPTNQYDTNLVFILRSSVDASVPLANWPVLATTAGTNRQVSVDLAPGQRFFVLTCSNLWGESFFSNVAVAPPAPVPGVLQLK